MRLIIQAESEKRFLISFFILDLLDLKLDGLFIPLRGIINLQQQEY